MRIAVFSYGLPVPGEKRGGIERAAHSLAQGLAERNHHVVVFTHDIKPAGASYDVRELPWKRFINTWIGRRMTMGYLGNVLAVIPDYREFDVIIAHGDSLLLPLTGKPIVRVMHGSASGEAESATSIGRSLLQYGVYAQELLTAFAGSGTVAVSENTRQANPFIRRTIPNGVDIRVFAPLPREKTAEPSIVFVGTQAGRKRGALLLEIFTRVVRAAHPNARLMFVGPAGDSIAGVSYHTGISDAELASIYRRAWVYASPSTYEGFGLPYLEAMASGTAVVATPNPGSREVLADGQHGRLVEDASFASALVELLNSEDSRRALESAGVLRAQQFSLDAMLDRYESLLAEMCGTHAQSIA